MAPHPLSHLSSSSALLDGPSTPNVHQKGSSSYPGGETSMPGETLAPQAAWAWGAKGQDDSGLALGVRKKWPPVFWGENWMDVRTSAKTGTEEGQGASGEDGKCG